VGGLVGRANAATLEEAFERSLDEASTLAFRVAYAVLRHREDAEDVAQEALACAYHELPRLRHPERMRSWLVRISWRQALQHRRARVRRERREQSVAEPPVPTTEELAEAAEFRARLWRAIDRLPEKLRLVVVLSGIEGHSIAEVARLLALPEGTVKSRLFLARKRLAKELR
jgi:RNA polymerase sigma-70 factor (ECF subfamily)